MSWTPQKREPGTSLVAALDAVLGHVLAAADVLVLLVTDQVGSGLLVNGDVLEDVGGKGLGLNVDVPAGQASGEAGVLPSLPMASDSWSSGTMTPA